MLRSILCTGALVSLLSACGTTQSARFELRAPGSEADDGAASRSARVASSRRVARRAPVADRSLPGGVTCLLRLRAAGLPHRVLETLANVQTPVRVNGPIDGVRFRPLARRPLDCDCRFALALLRAAPTFRALGVSDVYFSSAYRTHPKKRRRMSRHAMGLALDVHRLRVHGQLLSVKHDFQRGAGCDAKGAPLNQLACGLADGLFDRVLTPDTDGAHHNHFHLAILSLHRRRLVKRLAPKR